MKLFTKFGSSTKKFIHFHEVHYLFVEVHLVTHLSLLIDLLGGGPWCNGVVNGLILIGAKFHLSRRHRSHRQKKIIPQCIASTNIIFDSKLKMTPFFKSPVRNLPHPQSPHLRLLLHLFTDSLTL